MTRYRIPRRTGLGEDILDTGPLETAIAARAEEATALAARVEALEAKPVAKAAAGISLSSATPQALGAAAAGTGTDASRSDHVHPMPNAAAVGADSSGTAAGLLAAHVAAANPHTAYLLSTSFTWANLGSKPTSFGGLGITDGTLAGLFTSTGAASGFTTYDRANGTDTWTLYATGNSFHLYSGNGNLNVWSVARATGHMTLPVAASEFYRAAANSTTTTRQPRIWVGGSDPGAAAADGDLWIT